MNIHSTNFYRCKSNARADKRTELISIAAKFEKAQRELEGQKKKSLTITTISLVVSQKTLYWIKDKCGTWGCTVSSLIDLDLS